MTVDTVSVNEFIYTPETDTYTQYISKLPKGFEPWKQLFPNSDEEGFRLLAHDDPSMYVEYMQADVEHDDGNIAAFIFVAVPDSHTMRMGKLDSKVRIINF